MTGPVEQRERISPPTDFTGLHARLLLTGEALNPGKTDLPAVTREALGAFEQRDYSPYEQPSLRERTNYWQGKEDNVFDRQKQTWITNTASLFTNSKAFFTESGKGRQWSAVFSRLGIDAANFNQPAAEALYNKYFTGEAAHNPVKTFVRDALNGYQATDLSAIEWLANIFGHNSSEVVRHLVEAEAQLLSQPADVVSQANENSRLNNLNDGEKRILTFLWPNGQGQTTETTVTTAETPASPPILTPTAETPIKQDSPWNNIPKPEHPIKIGDREVRKSKGITSIMPETYLILGTREHPLVVETIQDNGARQKVRIVDAERPYHIPVEVYFNEDVTQEQQGVIQDALRDVFAEIGIPNNFALRANRSGRIFFPPASINPNRPNQVNGDVVLGSIAADPVQIEIPHHTILFTNKDLYSGDLNFVVGLARPDMGTVISLGRIWDSVQDERLRNQTIKTEIAHEVGHVYGLPTGRRGQQNIDYETVPGAGGHCKSPGCSMKQGNAVPEDFVRITQDRLNNLHERYFCNECHQDLQTKFRTT